MFAPPRGNDARGTIPRITQFLLPLGRRYSKPSSLGVGIRSKDVQASVRVVGLGLSGPLPRVTRVGTRSSSFAADRDRARASPVRSCGGCRWTQLIRRCSRFRRSHHAHPTSSRSLLALRSLARLIEASTEEANELSARSSTTSARSSKLLNESGVFPIVAAQTDRQWSCRDRVRSEAAFARLAGVAPLPASSGVRRSDTASAAAATASSTASCTRSSSTAANTTRRPWTTSLAASPTARQLAKRPGILKRYLAPPPLPRHAERDAADELTVIGDSFPNAGPSEHRRSRRGEVVDPCRGAR